MLAQGIGRCMKDFTHSEVFQHGCDVQILLHNPGIVKGDPGMCTEREKILSTVHEDISLLHCNDMQVVHEETSRVWCRNV